MNAREHEVARKITRMLDQGSRDLDRNAQLRLSSAREQALSLAASRRAPAWVPVWAAQLAGRAGGWPAGTRYLLPMAVLLLGLMGIVYWQGNGGPGSELADIDARLLTDDLPIDAYLDKGFDSWLKRQSR
ncbi:MAG: DUF3619 family protein [Burkholderiales bacterium]|jgi:hypothetical protein|nr:DUF3619 family protein [Burkholderiales bacterium]